MATNRKVINDSLKLMEKLMKVMKGTYPLGRMRQIYAEFYVAKKLSHLKPQIGEDREVRSADIYLESIGKRVEVKSCERGKMTDDAQWVWSLGKNQLKKKKFDYLVLVGFEKNGFKVEKVFVLTFNEVSKLPSKRSDSVSGRPYIAYFGKEEYERRGVKIEDELNLHPEKFEDRWNRMR